MSHGSFQFIPSGRNGGWNAGRGVLKTDEMNTKDRKQQVVTLSLSLSLSLE
jgi:hypothetical protein